MRQDVGSCAIGHHLLTGGCELPIQQKHCGRAVVPAERVVRFVDPDADLSLRCRGARAEKQRKNRRVNDMATHHILLNGGCAVSPQTGSRGAEVHVSQYRYS